MFSNFQGVVKYDLVINNLIKPRFTFYIHELLLERTSFIDKLSVVEGILNDVSLSKTSQ